MSSITYNGTDLSSYLTITSHEVDVISQLVSTVILPTRAYGWSGDIEPREITLKAIIQGTSLSNLISNLGAVKRILTQSTPKQLIFSIMSDRYYMATLTRFDGRAITPTVWEGVIQFICADQNAYSTSEDQNDHSITTDPKTVTETVGGTAPVYPVYKLTAGETLSSVTIKLKNENTGQEIQWTGSMISTDYLEINCVTWTVSKNGVTDMSTVDGEFPYLDGGTTNSITVTNFGTTGTLRITYRDRYY